MASRVPIATLLASVSLACASPDAPAVSQPEPVIASLVLTIGDDEGLGGEYLFGSVASVALDSAGRIYVADRTDSSLRVYSRDGGYLRAIGREGEGPGEFQVPLDLVFSANGDLWVRDLNRIQQLVRSANGTIPDSVVRTHPLTGYANTRPDRAGIADSLYYYPSYSYPLGGAARYFYEVFGPLGVTDTIPVPPLPNLDRVRGTAYRGGRLDRQQRQLVNSLALAPFEARPAWQITSRGTMLLASGAGPVVRELSTAHDLVRELRLPFARRAVPSAERADSLQSLRSRLSALAVPLDEVENASDFVRRSEVPDSLPTVLRILESADGRIWVETWPGAPGASDFIAFGPGGTVDVQVRVPMSLAGTPPPYFRHDRMAAVSVDSDTGIEHVVVFEFDR